MLHDHREIADERSSIPVAVVGTGRLARTLARSLAAGNGEHRLLGVHGRRPGAVDALIEVAGVGRPLAADDVMGEADVVFLAVRDDALAEVAGVLAATGVASLHDQLFVHGSGVCGLGPFEALREGGRHFATLHPLASLPEAGAATLAEVLVVCGGDAGARAQTLALAAALGARAAWSPDLDRPLYHAAAALLANGLTALFARGAALLEQAGGDTLAGAAQALMTSALKPLDGAAAEATLTGPVRRGDAATVAVHRNALRCADPSALALYDALMREALEISVRAGLDEGSARAVRRALSDDPGP
ncbi:MAG: hypothetical protein CMJ85_04230 [Planctomycetes bacterium]|nr:hypothetical protein [Planctomycetota bacterium]